MNWWLPITEEQRRYWVLVPLGKTFQNYHPRRLWFSAYKIEPDRPAPTISAGGGNAGLYHWAEPKKLNGRGVQRLQTFPEDYDFG